MSVIPDNPMLGLFYNALPTGVPKLSTRSDRIRIENFPLHTERPDWAAHAPAQVEAMCTRHPHIGNLTETRGPIMVECRAIAEKHGYNWIQPPVDAHRNVTLLVRKELKIIHHEFVVVNNNYRPAVTIDWHGRNLTAYGMHWEKHDNEGALVQTHSLIAAMRETSKGSAISFAMGDGNPSKPQRVKGSQPGTLLQESGVPTIYQELGYYPPGIGVNIICRSHVDTSVRALGVTTHDAMGSDHIPATALYEIKRVA